MDATGCMVKKQTFANAYMCRSKTFIQLKKPLLEACGQSKLAKIVVLARDRHKLDGRPRHSAALPVTVRFVEPRSAARRRRPGHCRPISETRTRC